MKKITQLEIIEDTLTQPQPGMPPLHPIWKDWILRRVHLAKEEQKDAKSVDYLSQALNEGDGTYKP